MVASGLGSIVGEASRLGHRGIIRTIKVVAALVAIEGTLKSLGKNVTTGCRQGRGFTFFP